MEPLSSYKPLFNAMQPEKLVYDTTCLKHPSVTSGTSVTDLYCSIAGLQTKVAMELKHNEHCSLCFDSIAAFVCRPACFVFHCFLMVLLVC